jgi:hypothetical protein
MAEWEIVQQQPTTPPAHVELHTTAGWEVEAPVKPGERPPAVGKEAIKLELESAYSRFRDYLAVLTDYQWSAARGAIAAALVDLEGRPDLILMARQQRNARNGFDKTTFAIGARFDAALAGFGLTKSDALARFEVTHRILLKLLEDTAEEELPRTSRRYGEVRSVEDEFRRAAAATLDHLDRVNRRLAGR